MKIAILQSNYIPWKGVFDMINRVDKFVFLEDVQYTEHDWRNRNKILTPNGPIWITVPVKNSKRRGQLICEAEIQSKFNWQRKHHNAITINYSKAPYFKEFKWIIDEIYLNNEWKMLSDLNIFCTKLIAKVLGIKTDFINSCDLSTTGIKDDRIINICGKCGADEYLSGPSAKNYIVSEKFSDNNIRLEYMEYEYSEYKQVYKPFVHGVSVLDLIFNLGEGAKDYLNIK